MPNISARSLVLALALAFTLTSGAAYSEDSDPIGRLLRGEAELVTTKINENICVVTPEITIAANIAVLAGDDGILVIDDLLQPWTQNIRKAVSKIQKGPIKYLLNSHYHYDHAGSNAAFGGTSTIVAHKNVRKRLAEGRQAGAQFVDGTRPSAALPIITFNKNLSFHWNKETIDLIHFLSSIVMSAVVLPVYETTYEHC